MLARRLLRAPRAVPRGRGYSTTPAAPLKVAVIGAGPSGFYAASRILQLLPASSPVGAAVKVDMYERLPTPYGLARYGVAPDHPEVKNCQHKFDELTTDPRFDFFGNVNIESPNPSTHYNYPQALHIPLSSLKPYYNAILFTYGASLSNPLASVPGSSASSNPLGNVYPALAFVGWYNGHPAFADLNPDLSKIETVDIVGQGNVALDVARILLSPLDSLATSDLPESILHALSKSNVRQVRAVGRRGPAQVAFTTKELREMTKLPGVVFSGVEDELMARAKETTKGDRMRTRMLGLMEKPVNPPDAKKRFDLAFMRSPKAFLAGESGNVAQVEWEVTELEGDRAKPTGATETSNVDMVVESVGYRSEPIGSPPWAIPFDHGRGRLHNEGGRIVDESGHIAGAYTAGWVARGPVGVIASTMQDAYALVDKVLEDYGEGWQVRAEGGIPVVPEGGVPPVIQEGVKDGKVVNIDRWLRIDEAERKLGEKSGRKEREKFGRVEEMLAVQ